MRHLLARIVRFLFTPSGSRSCVCHERAARWDERHIGKGW